MDGVWEVCISCGDGVVDGRGGDPGGGGSFVMVVVGGAQAEAENRETQGALPSESLALGTSPGTYHLVSWTAYLVSLNLSFPISKGRMVCLPF